MKQNPHDKNHNITGVCDSDVPFLDIQIIQPKETVQKCLDLDQLEQKKQVKMMKMVTRWKTPYRPPCENRYLSELKKKFEEEIKQNDTKDKKHDAMKVSLVNDAKKCLCN